MSATRPAGSPFMEWAKTRRHVRYDLGGSGVRGLSLRELGASLDDLEIERPGGYSYAPLQRLLAARFGVDVGCVVAAGGASEANHLALAALIAPGDEVVMEHPVYEPLLALARWLGADVKLAHRRPEDGFRLDPGAVRGLVGRRTKAFVLSNLHNPSGVRIDDETLVELGAIARRVGAKVVVDEVYLETLWVEGDRKTPGPPTAFSLGDTFVVTSSLTKAYGLSGLRCGWILAERPLAKRMWRLVDLFTNVPAHPAECLSVLALKRLDAIADRARALLAANRALLDAFFATRSDLEVTRPEHGTVAFPRWHGGDVEPLVERLRERHDTAVTPGRFFGLPDHFRIGIGGETATVAAGLERLAAALDEVDTMAPRRPDRGARR